MTKEDKDALRSVMPVLEKLINECLEDAPILDFEKVIDGPHTEAMLAHRACVLAGFMKFGNLMQKKLQITRKQVKPRVKSLARTEADLPPR